MVARSRWGRIPYTEDKDGFPVFTPQERTTRVLFAPKAGFELVELHGMLDHEIDAGNAGSRVDGPATAARASAETTYPADDLPPYLPDPMAAEIAFWGLPGHPADEPYQIMFDRDSWDRPHAVRLTLISDALAPEPVSQRCCEREGGQQSALA
jgi:hypothetical protein